MDVVKGFVEGIVFKSEDTGYVVVKINSNGRTITAVGTVPFINEGQQLKLTGEWKEHKQFGKQFGIQKCEEIIPDTIDGIEKYLSSGVIRGIGPITARKIISHFGKETLNIMDNDINRLKEVEGIGEKKFSII